MLFQTLYEDFLFNNYIWYKTVEEGFKDLKTGFVKVNGRIFPFGYKRKFFFYFFYFSPLGTPYIFKEKIDFDEFFKKFRNILLMEVIDFRKELILSPHFVKIDSFHHYINLERDLDSIFKGYKKSLREQIRQAKRKGVTFRKMEEKDLEDFYKIYKKLNFQKFKKKPYPYDFLKSIFKNLFPERALGFIAEVEGKIATGVICLHVDKEFVLAFLQGTDPDYYHYRVSSFIFHEMIKYYKGKGFKFFSFGLTPLKSKGTFFFKESFGCERYGITIWRFVHPLYKLGKKFF